MTWLLTALYDLHRRPAWCGSCLLALKGVKALNWGFITDTPPAPVRSRGGFRHGIIGSLEIAALARR